MKNALLLTVLLGTMPLHAMAQTSAPVPVPAVTPAPTSDKCGDNPAAGQRGVAPASAPDDSADEEEKDDCQNVIGLKNSAKKSPAATSAGAVATTGISTTMLVGIGTAVAIAIGVASSGGSGSSTTHSAVSH